jgi:hypothetical protein
MAHCSRPVVPCSTPIACLTVFSLLQKFDSDEDPGNSPDGRDRGAGEFYSSRMTKKEAA